MESPIHLQGLLEMDRRCQVHHDRIHFTDDCGKIIFLSTLWFGLWMGSDWSCDWYEYGSGFSRNTFYLEIPFSEMDRVSFNLGKFYKILTFYIYYDIVTLISHL